MSEPELKVLASREYGPDRGFRPGTDVPRWKVNFIMNDGGMGDFLNYSAATVWLAKNAPWIEGRLFVPQYLMSLMMDIHRGLPHWMVLPSEKAEELLEPGTAMLGPSIVINGQRTSQQLLTVLGSHPIDVGFAYYADMSPAPEDVCLPVLDYARTQLPKEMKSVTGPYAVIPTGNSGPARAVQGRHINPIIDHLLKRGLTPVFLGKRDLLGHGKDSTTFADDINFASGIDLRDKTNIKEAAAVLQHATLTVGLDCGLLHLAAVMKDTNIIFGYNVTTIEHRAPRRRHGRTMHIALEPLELPCIGCQSRWRKIPVHQFDKCFYDDQKCLDMLFDPKIGRFQRGIDWVLEGK